jgi:ribonuclease HI
MVSENAISVYTDGSSFSHPRAGGVGIRLVIVNAVGEEECRDMLLPGYAGATNNQMEIKACITGIKEAMLTPNFASVDRIVVHSDSQYVVGNYKRAFFSWSRSGWRNFDGKPVENAALWRQLLKTVKAVNASGKRVEFRWVKGHSKDKHHKAADKLARQSGRIAVNPPISVISVRRKFSSMSAEPGSVPMKNQMVSIHIITDEYLVLQRCYKFKYEVVSKASPYYGKVDFAYSGVVLRAGHCYSVRFNDNQKNPTITKRFKEVPCKKPERR